MAMTAPGMGLFCGTASRIKTFFSLSKYIGLDETSINLRPLFYVTEKTVQEPSRRVRRRHFLPVRSRRYGSC
jgi:hypothetical protein